MDEVDSTPQPEEVEVHAEEDNSDFIDIDLSEVPDASTEVPTKAKVIPRWVRHCLCPYICMGRHRALELTETTEQPPNDVANNNDMSASENGPGDSNNTGEKGEKRKKKKMKKAKKSKARNNTACCCCRNICPYICVKRRTVLAANSHSPTANSSSKKPKRKSKLPVVKMVRPKPLHIKPPGKHQAKAQDHAYVNEAAVADDEPAAVPYNEDGSTDQTHNPYMETTGEVDLDSVELHVPRSEGSVTPTIEHRVAGIDHVTSDGHVTAPTHVPPSPPLEAAPRIPEMDAVSNTSTESYFVIELPGA